MQPRARAIMLANYPEVARHVGLNPVVMLASAGIRPTLLLDPENWIPGRSALKLLEQSAARAGCDDFGIMLGECRTFASLGPVSLLLRHQHSLRDIINDAIEYRRLINELFHAALRVDGRTAVLEWSLSPGLNSSEGVNLLATIAYRIFVRLGGVSWQPDCIHFRDGPPDRLATFKRVFDCPLEFESSFDGLSFDARHLAAPNSFSDPELVAHARKLLSLLPGLREEPTTTERVLAAIPFLISEREARAEDAAGCLGIPVRTLQRKLEAEGSSYRDLLRISRRELATRYLSNPIRTITDVAHATGFSGVAVFTRWFTSEFGITPSGWRAQAVGRLQREAVGVG